MEKLPIYKKHIEEEDPPIFHTREQVYQNLAEKINEIVEWINNHKDQLLN